MKKSGAKRRPFLFTTSSFTIMADEATDEEGRRAAPLSSIISSFRSTNAASFIHLKSGLVGGTIREDGVTDEGGRRDGAGAKNRPSLSSSSIFVIMTNEMMHEKGGGARYASHYAAPRRPPHPTFHPASS